MIAAVNRETLLCKLMWLSVAAYVAAAFLMGTSRGVTLPTFGILSSQYWAWKTGHFAGFAWIGLNAFIAAKLTRLLRPHGEAWIDLRIGIGCVVIGALIEFAQYAVLPYHNPRIQDVAIDTFGGLVGLTIGWLLFHRKFYWLACFVLVSAGTWLVIAGQNEIGGVLIALGIAVGSLGILP